MVFASEALLLIALGCTLAHCSGSVGPTRSAGNTQGSAGDSAGSSGDNGLTGGDTGSGATGNPEPGDIPTAPPVVEDGTVAARAVASRVSGVAPLAVLFDATDSTGAARPFHDLHYAWNFGDADGGAWAATAHGKNTATGPVAAHVFTKPGTYQVSVTVRNAQGKGATAKVSVKVEGADDHWVHTTTCVSSDTDFTACPVGAQQITTTNFATIAEAVKPGRRILLRRGDKWAANANLSLDGKEPGMLGAFGPCTSPDARGICANAPEITSSQADAVISVAEDWRVMDLKFTGQKDGRSQNAIEVYAGTGTLLYRLRTEGFNLGITAAFIQDQLAMIDCDIGHAHTNQVNLGSERLMVLGNYIHDSSVSHVLRIWHAYKSVISENVIEHASLDTEYGRHALKLHGLGEGDGGEGSGLDESTTPAGQPAHRTELTVIADNTFGASPPWPVSIGPQNVISDERVSNLILERNFWRTSGKKSSSAPPLDTAIHCTARGDVTIRNNIFDATGAASDYAALDVSKGDSIPVNVTGIHFLNNLVYRSDQGGGAFTMVRTYPNVDGTVLRNNLGVAPAYGAAAQRVVEGDASGTLADTNSFLTMRFVEEAPVLPFDFRPVDGAASIDKGQDAVVVDDFARAIRPQGKTTDLGPYEHVSP